MTAYTVPAHVATRINQLVNIPWTRDGGNCWRLAREIIALLGYDLPPVLDVAPEGREGRELKRSLFNTHPERAHWHEVISSKSWALALMRRDFRRPDDIEHAGVYFAVAGGHVFHTCEPHGAVWDSLAELYARKWVPIFLVPRERK